MTELPHTVLVVDDEFASLEVLALLLAGEGFHAVMASNGEEALIRLAESPIALVITDYKMPKMDGSELCLRMLAEERFAHIPVIMVSSMFRQDVPKASNVVAFFGKPLLFRTLLGSVQKFLGGASSR